VVEAAAAGVRYIACQKPLATSVADAESMVEAAEKAGSKVLILLDNRANPLDRAARYAIQNGLLGRVSFGEARLDDNISVPTALWGSRSREWATTSSTAYFLLSHVSDLIRWYFAPAEVERVYAFSRSEVLGYTPDVYDAYLFLDTGLAARVKAEWVKEMEDLVEFYLCFTGTAGTLVYNKLPGYGAAHGLCVSTRAASLADLEQHQERLLAMGIRSRLTRRHTKPRVGDLDLKCSLEFRLSDQPTSDRGMLDYFLDAIEEGKDIPSTWEGNGGLPYALDGLKQTAIVEAIVESARSGREVAVR
jgi:predicted dehydrogenase